MISSYRIVLLLRLFMRLWNKARGCLARGFGGAAVWKLGAGMGRSPAALRVLVLFLYIRKHEHKANNQTLVA
jgi:hypothetical protein